MARVEELLLSIGCKIDNKTFQQAITKQQELKKNFDTLKNNNIGVNIKKGRTHNLDVFNLIPKAINKMGSELNNLSSNKLNNIKKQISNNNLITGMKKVFNGFLTPLRKLFTFAKDFLLNTLDRLKGIFKKIGGGIKTIFSGWIKKFGIFITGLIANVISVSKKTSNLMEEFNWQHTQSKTAFSLMNTAATSSKISEQGVSDEIVEIMKNQRQKQTLGVAGNTQLETMLGRFGVKLTEPVEEILQKLTKASKTFNPTQFYTMLQNGGMSNLAKAIIERNKKGEAPQIYNLDNAKQLEKFSGAMNRSLFGNWKKFQTKLAVMSIPFLTKLGNLLSKLMQMAEPVFLKIFGWFNSILSGIDKELNKKQDMGTTIKNILSNVIQPVFTSILNVLLNVLKTIKDPMVDMLSEVLGRVGYSFTKGRFGLFADYSPEMMKIKEQDKILKTMETSNNTTNNNIKTTNNNIVNKRTTNFIGPDFLQARNGSINLGL